MTDKELIQLTILNLCKFTNIYTNQQLELTTNNFNKQQKLLKIKLLNVDLDKFNISVKNNRLRLDYFIYPPSVDNLDFSPWTINIEQVKQAQQAYYANFKVNSEVNSKVTSLSSNLEQLIQGNHQDYVASYQEFTKDNVDLLLTRFGPLYNHNGLVITKACEQLGIACTNSYQAIVNCRDKFNCYLQLTDTTPLIDSSYTRWSNQMLAPTNYFNYPLIRKPNSLSAGGNNIVKVESSEQHSESLFKEDIYNYGLSQELVSLEHMFDLRIMVVNKRVTGAYLRVSSNEQLASNIAKGAFGVAWPLEKSLEQQALAIVEKLGLDICGLDFIYNRKNQQWMFIEANACPGFYGYDRVLKQDFSKHLLDYALLRTIGYNQENICEHNPQYPKIFKPTNFKSTNFKSTNSIQAYFAHCRNQLELLHTHYLKQVNHLAQQAQLQVQEYFEQLSLTSRQLSSGELVATTRTDVSTEIEYVHDLWVQALQSTIKDELFSSLQELEVAIACLGQKDINFTDNLLSLEQIVDLRAQADGDFVQAVLNILEAKCSKIIELGLLNTDSQDTHNQLCTNKAKYYNHLHYFIPVVIRCLQLTGLADTDQIFKQWNIAQQIVNICPELLTHESNDPTLYPLVSTKGYLEFNKLNIFSFEHYQIALDLSTNFASKCKLYQLDFYSKLKRTILQQQAKQLVALKHADDLFNLAHQASQYNSPANSYLENLQLQGLEQAQTVKPLDSSCNNIHNINNINNIYINNTDTNNTHINNTEINNTDSSVIKTCNTTHTTNSNFNFLSSNWNNKLCVTIFAQQLSKGQGKDYKQLDKYIQLELEVPASLRQQLYQAQLALACESQASQISQLNIKQQLQNLLFISKPVFTSPVNGFAMQANTAVLLVEFVKKELAQAKYQQLIQELNS